jgi:hypothetical protein
VRPFQLVDESRAKFQNEVLRRDHKIPSLSSFLAAGLGAFFLTRLRMPAMRHAQKPRRAK